MIDSGADVNTIGESDWINILGDFVDNDTELKDLKWGNGKRILSAYAAKDCLSIEASFSASITVPETGRSVEARFFVIRGGRRSLLGRDTATMLGVLKMGARINSCEVNGNEKETVQTFPKVPGELVHFDVDSSVQPTKNAYFNVPAAFRERVRERLDKMLAQGIIEKVESAPKWISGMSMVPKGKSDFRLVINMRGPNKAIKRAFHHLPTIDEMKTKLTNAAVFSKLDITSAFHHLELDEESRELTTFQTESGMRRFTRLMFGVNCAPEVFQRTMERKLAGIEGVVIFIDDILIYATNLVSLRARTTQVMAALAKNNLTLNKEKCEFEKTEVRFLGHRLSKEGFSIDDDKIRDVQSFEAPKNVTDLRSFLGLASYLSEYIPRFADLVNPMWEAVKATPFSWTREAEMSFQATKDQIARCTRKLSFFNTNARTIIYTDASPHALGVVLTQEIKGEPPRVICFASKTLTETEKRYPQIQKEALGIVWGTERLYYYLLGREFTIRTDARGLAFIFNREKVNCKRALNRAEGWALRMSAYDYKIEWIKGESNIADSSSRLCMSPSPFERKEFRAAEICSLSLSLSPPSPVTSLEAIRHATWEDMELKKLSHALETDAWPKELSRFEKVKDELQKTDGMILRAGAIVIPKKLRTVILQHAHVGHPGISAMKSILRGKVWWPNMPLQAEELVKNCMSCAITGRAERPVPMKCSALPEEAWQKLAIDFNGPHAACGGRLILVLVDYYSRFVIARFVRSTDTTSVVPVLHDIFELLGNPLSIRADNGPPFNGSEWKEFCASRAISCEFSTPGYPQQNGLVERYMQVMNKAITGAVQADENCEKALQDALNAHNSAVQRTTNVAPEILLFGRKRRGRVPMAGGTASTVDPDTLRGRDQSEKERARSRENKKRRACATNIEIGDEVFVKRLQKSKDQTKFDPIRFKVTSGSDGDFTIEASDGRKFTRNQTQLKKAPPACQVASSDKPRLNSPFQEPKGKRRRAPPARFSDFVMSLCEISMK